MDNPSEREQIEALKKWWNENGKSIVIGIAVGVAVVAGYRGWTTWQTNLAQDASVLYAAVEDAVARGDGASVLEKGKELVGDYKGTPYAALASLAMAKVKVDTGELEDAAGHLDWVVKNAGEEGMRHVARLRLARVYLATQKPDAALAALAGVDAGSFTADYEEMRGDIYAVQGKQAEARKAYQLALEGTEINPQRREFIEMKLHDLPAGQPEPDAQPAAAEPSAPGPQAEPGSK